MNRSRSPAALFSHLCHLVVHAEPHCAHIDRNQPRELRASGVSRFDSRTHHTGVIERRSRRQSPCNRRQVGAAQWS